MSKPETDIIEILLAAHQRGQQRAIDLSIRTGVPLVVSKNGKIEYIKPKFKYVLVPIDSKEKKTSSKSKKQSP